MDSAKPSNSADAKPRSGVLVGRCVTIRPAQPLPAYFTEVHRRYIGKTGRVHAIVPAVPRDNPLVKVGFENGTQIVFFRKSELEVAGEPEASPHKHGARGSHLPKP
jgi:hypothetical protein